MTVRKPDKPDAGVQGASPDIKTEPETVPSGNPVLMSPKIVGPIPVSKDSFPYGTALQAGSYSSRLMKDFDYIEEEYFLFGYANIYGPGVKGPDTKTDSAAVEKMKPLGGLVQQKMPYATRLLMVRPRDNSKFSGRVHAYTFHNLIAHVPAERNLMRQGDAMLGLEGCSGTRFGLLEIPSGGIAHLHKVNLDRYRDLHFSYADPLAWADLKPGKLAEAFKTMDFGSANASSGIFLQEISRSFAQAPDVITQLAHALKSNHPAFPFEGKVKRLFSFGASGGTTILQPYIDFHHNAGMMPDGRPPFDGYLVMVGRLPETRPEGAVLAYLESENEFITTLKMGRNYPPDTDSPPFRVYQIPGAGHTLSAPMPEISAAQAGTELRNADKVVPEGIVGLSDRGEAPQGVLPYNKMNMPIIWGLWHNLYAWIEQGIPMPKAPLIERDPKTPDGIARDEYGNALGGLRTPWVEVPDATYLAKFSPKNPLRAGMRPFGHEKMKGLYGSRERYLQLVNEKIDQMIQNRWILPQDADLVRLKS